MKHGVEQVTQTSPPQAFVEPLTLSEMKAYLRLDDVADPARDALIESLITAAREQAELTARRDVVAKQYDLYLQAFPPGSSPIQLRDFAASIDAFSYWLDDGSEIALDEGLDYVFYPQVAQVAPPESDSWPSDTFRSVFPIMIRYTVNPPPASESIKAGMRELVALWFETRLPIQPGSGELLEIPWTVSRCFLAGSRKVVR